MGTEPRIVLWDLETLPNLKEVMKVFPSLSDYPGKTLKAQINSIICFGYKIYGERGTKCISAWDFPGWKKDLNDDKKLCKAAYEILVHADCVVTHNGRRFDWKFFQTRLIKNGLPPLPKIAHVDTCQLAKQNLFFLNNKLATLSKHLTEEEKMDNGGWDLWVKVYERDRKAMKKMSDYCKQDVIALDAIFKALKLFAERVPNYNLFHAGKSRLCPSCGGTRLQSRGYHYTKTSLYRNYQCIDCRSWSRTNASDENPRRA